MATDPRYPYYQDPNARREREEADATEREAADEAAEPEADLPEEEQVDDEPRNDAPPVRVGIPAPTAGAALGSHSAEPQEADEDDESFDDLGPDEHDAHLLDEDAREDEIHCPACGELTYDDSPQCANCGHWISEEESSGPSSRQYLFTAIIVAVVTISLLLYMAMT